jgi:DNA-binding MarR family transcriptional regulator
VVDKATTTSTSAEVELSELRAEVAVAVVRLYRRFRTDRIDGDLGEAAITVLTMLYKDGPQSLRELSDHERVTPASMSQTVNRLTAAGYAVRSPDPDDGRKVLFSTTPSGDELVAKDRNRRHSWFISHLRRLSDEDRAALARSAEILREIADAD